MKDISDEELKTSYYDILQGRKSGILAENSIIRKIHEEFNKQNETNFPFYQMDKIFLKEIAKKYYENDEK